MKHILENFCRGTGQLVNPEKCSLLFNDRCAEDIRDHIAFVLGTNCISFEPKYQIRKVSSHK
jgi:hypothetical protein